MYEQVFISTTEDGVVDVFKIDSGLNWIAKFEQTPPPGWTILENDMCSDCKYAGSTTKYCKAAIGLYSAVKSFSNIKSITRITLTTITTKGSVSSRCATAQEGLSILFFSCLVFSGCYRFNQFKWAWDYYRIQKSHTDMFFTLFSSYITKRFILGGINQENTLSSEIMQEFKLVYNSLRKIVRRVRKASEEDANLNALVRLASMTHLFQMSYEDYIKDLKQSIIESD